MDDSGLVAFGLEGKEGHGLGGIWRKLLHQLNLEATLVGSRPTTTKFSADADAAAKRAVEQGNVNGEGDAVLVLAGDAVVVKESFFPKLSHGLNAIAVEEVVEEESVVSGEVHVAYPPHLV